jgi:glycosyltransferase involved in cell wall biosynthesis
MFQLVQLWSAIPRVLSKSGSWELPEIHVIILTFNEELHIGRCIDSITNQCTSITVVDSGSTDRTVEIAHMLGAQVLRNPWINYATQLNYAIDALADRGGWLLRIDADEVLAADSPQTLKEAITAVGEQVAGILVQRRLHFMGRRIRHGAIEPSWQLRLWRNGRGRCERRWMDEHIKVNGGVAKSGLVIADINLNSLTWWITKHNGYASREAIDLLNRTYGFLPRDELGGGASFQAKIRRVLKERLYRAMPAGIRSLAYFIYRYVFRLGFFDGAAGYYFHVMHAFWYRTLVDAKMTEICLYATMQRIPISQAIRECTGIEPTPREMLESRPDKDLLAPDIKHVTSSRGGTPMIVPNSERSDNLGSP